MRLILVTALALLCLGDDLFHMKDNKHTFTVGGFHVGVADNGEVRMYTGTADTDAVYFRVHFGGLQEAIVTDELDIDTHGLPEAHLDGHGDWVGPFADPDFNATDFEFNGTMKIDHAPHTCNCPDCSQTTFKLLVQIFGSAFSMTYGPTTITGDAGIVKLTYTVGCWPFGNGTSLLILHRIQTKGDYANMTGPDLLIGAGRVNFETYGIVNNDTVVNVSVLASDGHNDWRHNGGHNDGHGPHSHKFVGLAHDETPEDREETKKQEHEHEKQDWHKTVDGTITIILPKYDGTIVYDPAMTMNSGLLNSASSFMISSIVILLALLA